MQMDKASIVGDALLYVQDMQMQAKKLKAEIAELEASLEEAQRYQVSTGNPKMDQTNHLVPKTITQVHLIYVSLEALTPFVLKFSKLIYGKSTLRVKYLLINYLF